MSLVGCISKIRLYLNLNYVAWRILLMCTYTHLLVYTLLHLFAFPFQSDTSKERCFFSVQDVTDAVTYGDNDFGGIKQGRLGCL